MKSIKILGWSWFALGGVWSLLVILALLSRDQTGAGNTVSEFAWWEEFVGDTMECAVFVTSAIAGLGLLWGWHWCRLAIWVLSIIWLAFSVLMVTSADGILAMRLLWFGPSLVLSLYSILVLVYVRSERKIGSVR